MLTWFFFILQFSSIACAVIGGVFLAFSDFIMRSLDKAAPGAGIDAMQVINREVIRSVFVTLLLVLSAASPFMIGYAFIGLGGLPHILTALGGATYLFGVFGVTVMFNIPMNNRLDRDAPASAESLSYWKDVYFPKWTLWNHVRAAACIASAVFYLAAGVALVQMQPSPEI